MKKKNLGVPRVRLSEKKRLLMPALFIRLAMAGGFQAFCGLAHGMDVTTLKSKIPGIADGDCRRIVPRASSQISNTKMAKATYSWFDGQLQIALLELIDHMENQDGEALAKLFHPRIKASAAELRSILSTISSRIGEPVQPSIGNVWALLTEKLKPVEHYCQGEQIGVWSQSGYPVQIGVWLQLLGSEELAKGFLLLVPYENRYVIGAMHFQQWTHQGKTPEQWLTEVEKLAKANHELASFAYLDIVAKLVNPSPHYRLDVFDQIYQLQKSSLKKANALDQLRRVFPSDKLVYTGGILHQKGIGLLIRMEITEEPSLNETKAACERIWKTLGDKKLTDGLEAIRCSYIFPKEKKTTDGVLGSVVAPSSSATK
jgi:hypothetical protein